MDICVKAVKGSVLLIIISGNLNSISGSVDEIEVF